MFAVVGTFVDFSGDAQTCIAKQQQRVLLTFNLTQAILDRSPAGLIVTPGLLPERTTGILVSLLEKQNLLKGKKIAVVGDGTEGTVVKNYVVPALKKANVPLGATAVLNVSTTGDTTASQQQLDSFIERWKTQGVNTIYLSGDLVSSKQFVQKIKTEMPKVSFLTDTTDVLDQAQQLQQEHLKSNPYRGHRHRGRSHPARVRQQPELDVLQGHLQGRDRQDAGKRRADDHDQRRQDRRHLRHDQRRVSGDHDVPRHRASASASTSTTTTGSIP